VKQIPPPPLAERTDTVDLLHGEAISDPYRWLEDERSERTRAWTDAQSARTREVLDALPERPAISARVRELLGVGLLGVPHPTGAAVFYERRLPRQRQSVLHVRDASGDRPLVDPNALDEDALITLDWWYPSTDGRFVAYGLSRGGTELSTLHVIEVADGRDVGERIPNTQRSRVAWVDGGFYYTVHPAPGTVPPGDEHYHRRVRFHRLGDDPSRDELVFGEGRPKEDILTVDVDEGGRWAVLSAYQGWVRDDVYLLDRTSGRLAPVIEGADGLSVVTPAVERLWIRTNIGSPNYRIAVAEPAHPTDWRTVVPEGDSAIEAHAVTRSRLVVHTLERACSRLGLWSHDGRRLAEVDVGGRSSVAGLAADPRTDRFGYTVESFVRPAAAYLADATTGGSTEVARLPQPEGLASAEVAVAQETYRSKDGTEVSMFLIHRRDVRPNGAVPTVLTGYGGFDVSRTPTYMPGVAFWAEQGGLVAIPNLRGGGEYGERWHRAGMLANKQNVFDDFHAAAEALVARGWTRADRLGISGGSNGGLLVGAALTQRPELFAAVYCAVPLLDMLRYQRFLIARFWIAEYGSAEDPEHFRWLRAYSPYHHVRPGVSYPAVLFTTAEGDSRVDPMHARKMAALVQWAQRDDRDAVTLLRVDRDAGHGVGKPLDKQVDDLADQYAFLAWRLGLRLPERADTVALGR